MKNRICAKVDFVYRKFSCIPFDRYHTWMSDPELQKLTASEPLTIEQEYEMQETWRNDEDSKNQ